MFFLILAVIFRFRMLSFHGVVGSPATQQLLPYHEAIFRIPWADPIVLGVLLDDNLLSRHCRFQ